MIKAAFQQASPLTKLFFSFFIIISSFLILTFFGFILAMPVFGAGFTEITQILSDVDHQKHVSLLKYFQIIQSTSLFVVPSFILSYFFSKTPLAYLSIGKKPGIRSVIISILIVITAVPFINVLAYFNEQLQLPDFMESIERWLEQTEERARMLTETFLQVETYGALALNLFMIAVIPAVGEELLFRGVIQRLFTEWTKNVHWGIWISAALFSAMHLQFYGFVPRAVLGGLFGYMLVWSGNMWLPVIAHFFNNAVAVVAYFFIERNWIDESVEEIGREPGQWVFVSFSLLFMILFLSMLRAFKKESGEPDSGNN